MQAADVQDLYDVEMERQRLARLAGYRILDTPPEERFDRIARIARQLFGTPFALISLIDQQRQWFKSAEGLPISETPRDVALCNRVVSAREMVVLLDTWSEPGLREHPVVTSGQGPRFYAGAPLRSPDGYVLGTLCLMDPAPRAAFNAAQRQALQDLADLVIDEMELRRLLGQLSHQALHDALTGLPNRTLFEEMLGRQLEHARRFDEALAVMVIDLDGFKHINDSQGHPTGDRVLEQVARCLSGSFRVSDTIACWGGDEFAAVLPLERPGQCIAMLRRVTSQIARSLPGELGVEMSIGVALYPLDGDRGEVLLAHADAAMYMSKRAGGNRCTLRGGQSFALADRT